MPRLVEAAAAALPTDSNNEAAAALQANSKELEEPTPKKQRIKQHGIKTKSSKQTIVSASRPRNEEEKEELKKSGSMFGYINLPRGRDESSYLASDGVVNVIGGRGKKKHKKNMADCRESITVVRVGSSSGVDGPRVYLAKGKEIELNSFKDFTANYKAPHGSHIVMTPNAYMTDEAWRELVPKLCEGIRAMDRVIPNCLF